jgi:FMN phosphatase YigB (HAD superfamily)
MKKNQNIIFDLGGVLLNLNFGAIERRFQELLGNDYYLLFRDLKTQNIFNKFEIGAFSEEIFLDYFLKSTKLTHEQVLTAWNSILLDLPLHRLDFLKRLRKDYNIYLLSNTNYTHVQKIEADLKTQYGIQDFRKEFFEIGYYSFEMGMRKPENRIFQAVLEDANLNAADTIFIDDNKNNIKSAANLGIQTILHEPNAEIEPVLMAFL